jgi:integrase
MAKRLTDLACARARPVPGKRLELYDGAGGVPGLALRITERGIKSWSVYYRVGGRLRRLTLGRYPDLSLVEARRRARQALEQADRGFDPAGRAEGRRRRDRFAEVAADYLELHCRRNRHRAIPVTMRFLRPALAAWGPRPIQSITKRDVLDLVDGIAGRAPTMANRTQALLKRLFAWAVEREIIAANPLAGLRPPAREASRDRVLSGAELGAIWRAAGGMGWPWAAVFRLLILTGARKSEATGMAWAELDLERRTWVKPAARTKSGREHALPLPEAALEIITSLPQVDGSPWLFPSRTGGPTSRTSDAKARLDRLAGVRDWRVHDLRRTAATGLAELGALPHVIQEVLGHAPPPLLGRYQRYRFEAEVRAALEDWAEHVLGLADGGKVIPIKRA